MTDEKQAEPVDIGKFQTDEPPAAPAAPAAPAVPKVSEGLAAAREFMGGGAGSMAPSTAPSAPGVSETSPLGMGNPAPAQEAGPADAISEARDLEENIAKMKGDPRLTYEQKLKRHTLTKQQAAKIVDSLIVSGYYEHPYRVTSKYHALFRTRDMNDQDRLMSRIEEIAPKYPASLDNLVGVYNLASSIRKFGTKDLTELEFVHKFDWVTRLPGPLADVLLKKLASFDQMMLDVMDAGAIENF
jgi:hypothetical protein